MRSVLLAALAAAWVYPFGVAAQPLITVIDEAGRIFGTEFDAEAGGFAEAAQIASLRGGGTRRGIVVGDFDGDGDDDLIAGAMSSGWTWYQFIPRGEDGGFAGEQFIGESTREGSTQMDMAAGDLNHDGHLDFVANHNNQWMVTFLGDGTGRFVKIADRDLGSSGRGLDLADFDRDGHLDLVRARYSSGYIDVYRGVGDGTFGGAERVGDAGGDPYGLVAGDFDLDGFADVMANAGSNGDITWWRGNGDGTFQAGIAAPTLDQGNHGGFDALDFDGDGDLDVVACNYTGRQMRWYPGNGDGTFAAPIALTATPSNCMASATGPLPNPAASRALIAAGAETPINVPIAVDGTGSTDVARFAWDFGFAPGPQGNGGPGVVNPVFFTEGIFPITLQAYDAAGQADVARVEIAAVGEAPVIDATPIQLGEADAARGEWSHVFDVAELVEEDMGLAWQRWSSHRLTQDFEAGLDGWWLTEGTWVREEAAPLAGAASFRQTNAGSSRSRVLFRDMRYTGDVEIEFDVRMVAGNGQEIHLLLGAQDIYNNYEFILRGRGADDVLFYRRINNGTSNRMEIDQPAGSALRPITTGRTYHVRVTHVGNRLDAWVDGLYVGGVSDGSFKAGMVGLSTYQTDAIFDNLEVREIGSGPTFSRIFQAPGAYTVDLTVADAAGQVDTRTIPVIVSAGEAPSAVTDPGPHAFDEFTGAAVKGVYTAALDGTASSDPEGSALTWQWDLGPETFDGQTLDRGYWMTSDAGVTQDGALRIVGNGRWGERYAFTRGTFTRAEGLVFEGRINATNRLMLGLKNQNDTAAYQQYVYALYFNNGSLAVYENGASRSTRAGYTRGADYDVRIEVLPEAGARYSYRRSDGDGIWREIYRSGHSDHATFRMGLDVLDGTAVFDDWRRMAAGAEASIPLAGPAAYDGTLTVTDSVGNSDTAPFRVVLQPNDPPVADAGGDLAFAEPDAVRGRWTVDLDGAASADDHGIDTYEWDFSYDPEAGFEPAAGATAAQAQHVFDEGIHRVAVRVTDHARQSDIDVVTVTTDPGQPPIANAGTGADGGPYVFDEFTGDAIGGGFQVTLDGRASRDDESDIRWVWDFGVDTFTGGYNPEKWVMYRDNATVETVPPPGDACTFRADGYGMQPGRRFRLECPAGCALEGRLWGTGTYTADSYVCLAAMHAGVLPPGGAGVVDYRFGGAEASFEGSVANGISSNAYGTYENVFTFIDGSETGLHLGNPSNTWGARWAYLRQPMIRTEGLPFEMRVRATRNNAMFGLRPDVADLSYRSMHYAFYFSGGSIYIYESANNRGDTGIDYAHGVDYDLRIELKHPQGAVFSLKRADEDAWTQVYDSTYSGEAQLHPAIDVYRGSVVVSEVRHYVGGPEPTWRLFGVGEHPVELTVYDQAEQSATVQTSVTLRANDPPVAEAGPDVVLGEAEAERGTWTVAFDGSGSTDDHGLYRYEWDFDYDGERFDVDGVGVEVEADFFGAGTDTVGLRVWDHALQPHIDTLTVEHEGSDPPIANAGQNTVTEGVWPVAFDGSRSTDDVAISRFEWDFGDGMTGVGARPNHSYWQPGVYQVTLTVYDRAEQSDTDTIRVVVRAASDPPVAEAGGPYRGGAGGPPAHFDGRESEDDFGVVKHFWDVDITVDSDGDGDPTNDVDVVGPRPMWTYAEVGEYTIALTVTDGAGQTATDQATVEIVENLPPEVVTVPWVAADPRSRHHIINGRPTRLKAIVRDAGALTYQWDFGDGSPPSPAEPAPVSRKDAIEITHTYPVSPIESPFIATLTVWDEAGESSSDIYPLIVQPDDLDTETNIAIEESLWWLHKAQRDDGWWESRGYYTSPTSSALHAFVLHGHDQFGDLRENPFAETVYDGFHYLFRRLRSFSIEGNEDDTNGNGLAVDTNDGRDAYQMGTSMDALVSTNQPLYYAPSGDAGLRHRFYHELVWDMADAYYWGQSRNGGWYYSWNSGGSDNSAAQWGAIGIIPAREQFRIPVPQYVKDRNMAWLRATSSSTGFGYSGSGSGPATTAGGMVQLVMNDVSIDDPLWTNGENWMANRWRPHQDNEYAVFAQVKAMRLAGLERFRATGLDWFNDPVDGLRRRLLDSRIAGHTRNDWGRWYTGISWTDDEMATAWGVIMLTPTLFQQPPVANAGRDITWAFDIPVRFDASQSTHRDTLRRLVKYEWDFDGDGVYDLTTDDPRDPRAVFTYPDPQPDIDGNDPEIWYARLRVTDDNVPPQTDTDVRAVTVKDPPYQPIADIGGPYRVAAGVPFQLDGSGSFDLDPEDSITLYEWDLTEQGPFFEAIDVRTDQPVITHTFPAIGRYVIGLRVRDTGRFNPPDCVVGVDCRPETSTPVFTTVEVVENQPPVPAIRPVEFLDEGGTLRIDGRPTADPEGSPMVFEWRCDGIEPVVVDGTDGRVIELRAGDRDFPADGERFDCTLAVSDIAGAQSGLAFQVVGINRPPVIASVAGQNGVEGGTVQIDIAATDPAPADAERLIYSVDCDGDGVIDVFDSLASSVECSYADDGVYVVAAVVDDDDGGQAVAFSAPVVIANLPPTIVAPPCPAAVEGTPVAMQFVTGDPAGEADPVLCGLVPPIPDGAQLDAAACRLLWTPTYEQAAGEVRFAIIARDDDGGRAEAAVVCAPQYLDEDGDGLPDTWEVDNDLDPTVNDCEEGLDADGDGIDNCAEYDGGTDPHVPDETTPPVLLDPVDDARVDSVTPALVLENARDSLDRPLSYEYTVYADAALEDIVTVSPLVPETPDTTEWTVDEELDENTWYWWTARAFNGDGWGPPAPVERFLIDAELQPPTPPTIVWPADGDAIAELQPTLLLDESTDPDAGDVLRYVCEISLDGIVFVPLTGGEAPDADEGPQTEVPTDAPLDENAAYRARCKAVDQTGLESDWSNVPRFTINLANDPPTAPTIIDPPHTATIAELQPTLVAGNAVDPEGEPLTYVFWLSPDPTFPPESTWVSAPLPEGDGETAWPAPEVLQDNTTYYWRVQARDPFVGGPAASARFRVDLGNEPPSAPVALDPADGDELFAMRPLVWSPSVDPDGDPVTYEVLLVGVTNDLLWSAETPETTIEYPGELGLGRYAWRVRARDDRGGQSEYSARNVFRIVQEIIQLPDAALPDAAPDMAPDMEGDPGAGRDLGVDDDMAADMAGDPVFDRGAGQDDMAVDMAGDPAPDMALIDDDLGPDAGVNLDGGPDAQIEADGGDRPPRPDGEVEPDSTPTPDAGDIPPGEIDGAVAGGEGDGPLGFGAYTGSEGCQCEAADDSGPSPWMLGLLLFGLSRRRGRDR